jgi:hypothetical protein
MEKAIAQGCCDLYEELKKKSHNVLTHLQARLEENNGESGKTSIACTITIERKRGESVVHVSAKGGFSTKCKVASPTKQVDDGSQPGLPGMIDGTKRLESVPVDGEEEE